MLIPIHIECENFLVFKDKQEFTFKHSGIHYIYGVDYDAEVDDKEFVAEHYNVGVGKSSLAMLMEYALYGEIQKNIKKKDRIINKKSKKNLFVRFDFLISSTNEKYRIERYRKHDYHKNDIYLYQYCEGEEEPWKNISELDKSPTQELINNIIILDKKTFEKSVLFTRDDKTQFLELSTTDRGGIFENVSQIAKLKKYRDKAQKRLKAKDDELAMINNEIVKLNTIITKNNDFISELQIGAEKKKEILRKEIDELNSKTKNISNINKPIDQLIEDVKQYKILKEQNDVLYENISMIDMKNDRYEKELQDHKSKISTIVKKYPSLQEMITQSRSIGETVTPLLQKIPHYNSIERDYEVLKNDINLINKKTESEIETYERNKRRLNDFGNYINSLKLKIKQAQPITCVKCGAIQNEQEFQNYLSSLTKDIETSEKELNELDEKNKVSMSVIENCNEELADMAKQLELIIKELEEIKLPRELKSAEKDLNDLLLYFEKTKYLKKEIDLLQDEKKSYVDRYKGCLKQIDELQIPSSLLIDVSILERLKDINEALKTKTSELNSIDVSSEIQKIKDDIIKNESELQDWKIKRELSTKLHGIYEFWIEVLDFKNENSIKQFVVSRVIPIFNSFVQQMVDAIFKGDMIITFDSFFNETIIFNGEDYDYEELSTGQKMKLNFCINLAIFDLTRVNLDGCSVIFMDEIFTNVDMPSILSFLNIIRERYAQSNGVYIISHQSEVKENLNPETITRIDKVDWSSNIVIEK